MLGGIKGRDSITTDDFCPLVVREFKPVLMIDILPHLILGRFRIEDQPVEIKNQSFDHSRQIIPECYTLYAITALSGGLRRTSSKARSRSACKRRLLCLTFT